MTIEIKMVEFDRDAVEFELEQLEAHYGVDSTRRHVPFMRRRWPFPFLRPVYELEETADWQRWEYLYTVWREIGGADDPAPRPDPRGLPDLVR